jgi:TldD protein
MRPCIRAPTVSPAVRAPTGVAEGAGSIAAMLAPDLAEEVLRTARRRGGDFAEVFAEERTTTSIRLDDGKVEELTTGLDRGAGVRVAAGTTYGYAYSNRLDRDSLLEAADAASAALGGDAPGAVVDLTRRDGTGINHAERPAATLDAATKVGWLREVDAAARALSPEVTQVVGVYGDSVQRRTIAASDGRWIEEERPRIRIVAQVVAKRGEVIQTGFHGPASCAGVEFIDRFPPRIVAEKAARRAVTMLDSIPAPAGEMTVVLAPGMGGVLLHEAVGHPLESDAVDKEASVYVGRVGERCASELLDAVDDATVPNGWGSFDFDDEGEPARRTVLFEKGVLQGYLTDRIRAAKLGIPLTGNGRRESYASPPIPRMTNTNILNGASKPEELVGGTEHGVYVTSLGGGEVNPATGDFVFGCSEAFLIERGEVTTPIRGANLIGRAIEVMSAVDGVADDFDTWEGVCGKDGQAAPVGSGSPTVRISRITVGGTGA